MASSKFRILTKSALVKINQAYRRNSNVSYGHGAIADHDHYNTFNVRRSNANLMIRENDSRLLTRDGDVRILASNDLPSNDAIYGHHTYLKIRQKLVRRNSITQVERAIHPVTPMRPKNKSLEP